MALAVTYPAAGNIGGGGYLLVMPSQGEPLVFDFREVGAGGGHARDVCRPRRAARPIAESACRARCAAWRLAHFRFGKLPWRDLVRPAIELARDGFALDSATARSLNEVLATSDKSRFAELHRVFGKPDGTKWRAGDRLKEPELAHTLQRIAECGADGFYLGEVAEKIVAEMKRGGGLIAAGDLASYRPLARPPLRGTYRGFEILGVPPSSSGGTTLIEALNILECFDLEPRPDFANQRASDGRSDETGLPRSGPLPRRPAGDVDPRFSRGQSLCPPAGSHDHRTAPLPAASWPATFGSPRNRKKPPTSRWWTRIAWRSA